ncbi:methyl-accepting chemotaxis protein, partial [Petrotoga sp. 9PWA.NaAc.5.4]
MKSRSISSRIISIIIVIFILFGVSILFNIFSLTRSNKGLASYKDLSDDVNNITELETSFFEASLNFKDYLVNYAKNVENLFKNNLSKANSYLNALIQVTEDSTSLKYLEEQLSIYENNFNQIVQLNSQANNYVVEFNNLKDTFIQELNNFDTLTKQYSVLAFSLLPEDPAISIQNIAQKVSEYYFSKAISDKNNILNMFSTFKDNLAFVEFGLTNEELKSAFSELMKELESLESTFIQIVETIESQEPIIQEMEEMRVEILNLLDEQRAELK